MKYKNPYYKKYKNSYTMLVKCGPCKADLVIYQKVGSGNLLKLYLERIIEANIDLWNKDSFTCPFCQEELGDKVVIEGKDAFRIKRGYVHTKRLD